MKTPVVLIIFNRKETTERIFQSLRQARPTQLFVISDAPRPDYPDESEKCEAVREIIDTVDWDCKVIKNYSPVNLGITKRLATGISWVFEQVEEAIIFEHDCLPHPSFFPFCEALLDYYKNDTRIMHIGGNNFQKSRSNNSYYFSHYPHIWGWATWRRAWNYYDAEMKQWPKVRDEQWLEQLYLDSYALDYWQAIFQNTYDGLINTWDYQWTFACWLQNGLSIVPGVNLVSNIGFGKDGVYTLDENSPLANIPYHEMGFPLQHPDFIIPHKTADKFTQDNVFQRGIRGKIKSQINSVLSKLGH